MHKDASLLLASSLLGWFGKGYTSSYIVDETITLTKARIGGAEALNLADKLTKSKEIEILRVEEKEDTLVKALERFRKFLDVEGMSFTDCTTLVLIDERQIDALLTFDRNFKSVVPKVGFGEGYHRRLSAEEVTILSVAAKKLGIKIQI
jgi:predicted nucleic acid-binding protein